MNAKMVGQALTAALLALAAAMAAAQTAPAVSEADISPTAQAATPPPPDRPAEMPANPPAVTCRGGELTIVANNSTLGSILTAVQRCIDVRFDVPEESMAERTFAHIGPGPTPTVLRSLLESTGDDFVIEPSATNPEVIRSVILIAHEKTEDPSAPSAGDKGLTPARRAWLEARRATRTPAPEDSSDQAADVPSETESVADTAAAEPPAPAPPAAPADTTQPSAAQPVAGGAAPTSAVANVSNNMDTATADGLQNQITNMRQLFQQREQMVQTQTKAQSPASSPSPQ